MLEHNGFRCPALAVAFAAAVHITDVRPTLLRGMRNVALTLLSYLLPLVTALAIGFLVALLFVGLKPLWATRRAATILLWACALTVFFLNAAYKDGDPATLPRGVLRWAGRLAGPALLLLAVLAAYAIGLRIHEYGWTPGRVISSAVALMALIYGGGYAYASSPGVQWLKPLESVNVIASLVVVTMLALLLTPLADPARLSVNSQLSRLAHGAVTADTFDYQFLRFDSGIYGRRGLARLARAAGTDAGARAARMLAMKTRQYFPQQAAQSVATEAAFSHATIYPQGSRLPDDFRSADWSSQPQLNGNCLRDGGACDIYILPHGDVGDAMVLVQASAVRSGAFGALALAQVFQKDRSGRWVNSGTFDHLDCPGVVSALQRGQLAWIPPQHDDLIVNGVRLDFSASGSANRGCTTPPGAPHLGTAHEAEAPARMAPAFAGVGGS